MVINYPKSVDIILNRLSSRGYLAYIVGGCVRNSILGLPVHDWDITTNATPQNIIDTFSEYGKITSGIKHGTVAVIIDKIPYEITTFRHDGVYSDNRHPDAVEFTDRLADDLSRRDFTVNAMAYSQESGVIDLFGGVDDIKARRIRCVGDANARFNEDALRIMRALRFASVLNFDIDSNTASAIIRNRRLLNNISIERINTELCGIICSKNPAEILDEYREVFYEIIPELKPLFGFEQHNPHHDKDIWKHTITAVNLVNNGLTERLSMLLHDIAKPLTFTLDKSGIGHFYGHADVGESMSKIILKRLRFSNEIIKDVSAIVKYHESLRQVSETSLKRILQKIGRDNMLKLVNVNRADIMAQSKYQRIEKLQACDEKEELLKKIISENSCFSLSNMNINGNDLKSLGIKEGKKIGDILNLLLDKIIENEIENDYSELSRYVIEKLI